MENAEAAAHDCSFSEQSKQRTEQSSAYFWKLTKWRLNDDSVFYAERHVGDSDV